MLPRRSIDVRDLEKGGTSGIGDGMENNAIAVLIVKRIPMARYKYDCGDEWFS